jgi:putative transposase
MNAVCERVIGTLRRELLDRILILSQQDLALVIREYLIHNNGHRPHQSRDQRPPDTETQPTRDATGLTDLRSIRRKPAAAGMISEYHHAA